MNSSVPFLRYLDLDEDADERAIRRAYAQRLKTIDQEADPEGFQALREAYATSMNWLQWHLQQQAESNTQPEPVPSPTPAPEAAAAKGPIAAPHARHDPRAMAETLREELAQALHERHFTEPASVRERLQQAIDDPRLIDMDARFFFEWGVAAILASGWQPGHELLFDVAIEAFDWRHDRARLLSLGREGQLVDSAIVELEAFGSREAPIYNGASREQLIRLLRKNERPNDEVLVMCTPAVEHMASLYPHWLHIVANTKNIAQWRTWEQELAGAKQQRQAAPRSTGKPVSPARAIAFMSLLFLALGVLLWWSAPADKAMIAGGPLAIKAAPAAQADALRQVDPPPVDGPARYRTEPRVAYPAQAKREGMQGRVIVGVLIRKNGEIGDVRVVHGSGYALLDEAAVKAVRSATFYPARAQGKDIESWYQAPFHFKLSS